MKTFNKITASLFVLCLLFGFNSCSEKVAYDPAELPGNAQVYFPNTLASTVALSQDMSVTTYNVNLYRLDKSSALTVNLTVQNESPDIFTVPTTASFAAGQDSTSIPITYDPVALGYDTYKSISISISDESLTSPYGNTVYSFTAGIPAPWKSLGMATYTDDFVSSFFGITKSPYQVEIEENLLTPGLFRLVNPYGAAYPFNDPGDWDDSQDYYMVINAVDPDGVYIPHPQPSGMNWGYGNFSMSSVAGLDISRGSTVDAEKAAGNCGKFENGVITFPVKSLLVSMASYPASSPGGWYYANNNGWFQVVMPGVVLADYSSSVEYSGRYTDADDNMFAVANVTLGADVEYAKVALVPGSVSDDAVNGVDDGSINSVQITAGGQVQIPCSLAGRYTFIVVTYANGVSQDYSDVSFNFTTGDASVLYPIEDFYGDYIMTGLSVFDDSQMTPIPVTIAAGTDPNTLVITGITYCASVTATFPVKGYMSIAPQQLADYGKYDITWNSVTPDFEVDNDDALVFTRLGSGDIVLTPDSYAIGYILSSQVAGGYVDGYYNISFSPVSNTASSSIAKSAASPALKVKAKSGDIRKHTNKANGKFVVSKKGAVKKALKSNLTPLF